MKRREGERRRGEREVESRRGTFNTVSPGIFEGKMAQWVKALAAHV